MPRIRLDPDGTGNSQLGGIDTPLVSNDAANMSYVDTAVLAAIAAGPVPSGNTLPTMNTEAGQSFVLLATDGANTPGFYYRNSANDAWVKDDTGGGDSIFRGRWQQNTAYMTGDVVFTDGTTSLFGEAVRNKIYRVENNFTSANLFDTANLAIIGERNTTYAIEAGTSTTANSADITLVGSDITEDDVTLTGGDNVTITRNSDSQITIAASGGVDSGNTLPTSGTTAGDGFILTATDGANTPGYYYRNSANDAWVKDDTVRTDAEINALIASGRVQRVRLDGTTLRFYYGTDVSGNGDFQADVSSLADFPFEHFTTITARNAFTGHGNRSIFATVANDTGDGSADPQGTFAVYVLTSPPAVGDSDQTTDNADWDRITSPDSIINEVCVQVYNEVTGMFEQMSLGTTSAVDGLTENTANGLYLRRDGNLGDVNDAETARENLGVPATTDLATVEFPNSDVETALTNIEFNDAGDQITFRNSDGMTQSFTGGGAPNGGYPTVGGIALEQLGSVTHGAGDTNSWPTGAGTVFGENADMITYTPGGGSGNQTVNGVLTNNTGATIDLGSGTLDIDITVTAITGVSLVAGFAVILPEGDATTPVINAPFSVQLPSVNTSALPARLNVRVPFQSSANNDWVDGGTIGLVVTENNAAERPFTYHVNAIRLSYTDRDFHKTGGHPDVVFAAADNSIHILDSISTSGNDLLFDGPTGRLTYSGGGSGDVSATDVITAWTSGTNYETGRLVYTTTGNATLNWRRNATAYSSDPATAEAERANSPDSTDGAALWAVLPPVVNTAANSPIVVDRSGFNVGVVDAQLRRVDASGRRLDLTPTAVTAGTYTNPHVTVDTYGRVVGALNGTALTDLPHTGYSYSRQDNLSDNLYTNRSQDVYNILGLHLAFNESAVDVAEGTELYIFDNGNADTGTHRLTLRRNGEPETDIFEGHTFVWDVIFGFDWLEQFLGPAAEGSSTRDLDLTSTAAMSAFSSLYTRDTITRPAVLERLGSGEVRWVYPQDVVDGDAATANNTVTKGGINDAIVAVNTRIDGIQSSPFDGFTIGGTASLTTPIPRWTADNTLTWSAPSTSGPGASTFVGLDDTPDSYPAGSSGFTLRVNAAADGIAFVEADDPGRLFNVNDRYEAGDLATTPLATTPISYAVWVLRDGTLDGRTTPLTTAQSPGGTDNLWFQLPLGGSDVNTLIPVYFDLSSTGQAQNLSLRVASTATHYALVRSDSYGLGFDVFNSDGTLSSSAAANLNTLNNNNPPYFEFLPLTANSYFAPAIDTPEQMHDDLREWVSRDFEVQLNPHPDAGMITGHTFTLGGETGTITNVRDSGRAFDISLTDAQRAAATLAINPATDNHVDMVFTWTIGSVTHTWTNPIDLIEDLATTQTIGDFTVRRGTATGVSPGAVLHTMDSARLRLSGSTFGYFHTIANLTEGQDYVLVIDDIGSYAGGEISNGQQYRITAPAINTFGGTFTDVRLITGGNVADTQISWTFDDIFQSENVDVSIHALETAAAGLEILSGGNVIFRLEPNGNVQIAGTLTQGGT